MYARTVSTTNWRKHREMLRSALIIGALALVSAVPLPKHRAHSTENHDSVQATAMTAAAAADLVTVLPGAPKIVGFKQYAGEMARLPVHSRADAWPKRGGRAVA